MCILTLDTGSIYIHVHLHLQAIQIQLICIYIYTYLYTYNIVTSSYSYHRCYHSTTKSITTPISTFRASTVYSPYICLFKKARSDKSHSTSTSKITHWHPRHLFLKHLWFLVLCIDKIQWYMALLGKPCHVVLPTPIVQG